MQGFASGLANFGWAIFVLRESFLCNRSMHDNFDWRECNFGSCCWPAKPHFFVVSGMVLALFDDAGETAGGVQCKKVQFLVNHAHLPKNSFFTETPCFALKTTLFSRKLTCFRNGLYSSCKKDCLQRPRRKD
jgi:hypothetical protein